jgi:hypothetical protein
MAQKPSFPIEVEKSQGLKMESTVLSFGEANILYFKLAW